MPPKRARKDKVADRDKRVKITNDMISHPVKDPRYMPPYFAHEPLNPNLYAGELTMPIVPVPNSNYLPYDIEANQGNEDEDSDEESAIGKSNDMPATLSNTATNPPAKSARSDNRVVVGCRPVEGKGRKLCGIEEMDEDDKLLFFLKLAKWSERDIHNKFVCEGRINYNIKTISTRFCRMRRFIMAENDKRLQEGTAVWLKAEEKLLPEAVASATKQIEKELEQRKWELVSEYIQKREPLAMYSGEACRRHYEATTKKTRNVQAISGLKLAKLAFDRRQNEAFIEHLKCAARPEK